MTDQPTRLEATQADHRTAQEIISLVAGALAEPDGCLDPDDIAAIVSAHRLAHTVPGDAGLREALEMCVWQLEEVAAKHMRDSVPGALAIQCEIKARKARAAISTSPVIDTNEGLAERVRELETLLAEAADDLALTASFMKNNHFNYGTTTRLERHLRAALAPIPSCGEG